MTSLKKITTAFTMAILISTGAQAATNKQAPVCPSSKDMATLLEQIHQGEYQYYNDPESFTGYHIHQLKSDAPQSLKNMPWFNHGGGIALQSLYGKINVTRNASNISMNPAIAPQKNQFGCDYTNALINAPAGIKYALTPNF
jgi:hypothetical protein